MRTLCGISMRGILSRNRERERERERERCIGEDDVVVIVTKVMRWWRGERWSPLWLG